MGRRVLLLLVLFLFPHYPSPAAPEVWKIEPRPGPVWKDMILEDGLRQPYDLGRATHRRLTVLALLGGHWDPYSIQLLKELRNAEQEILDRGFQIIAVSPDNTYRMRGVLDRLDLPFVLCSDTKLQVARSLGLARPMPAEREKALLESGIRFRDSDKDPVPQMADPSLVLLGEDGRVYLRVAGLIEKVPFDAGALTKACGQVRLKSAPGRP